MRAWLVAALVLCACHLHLYDPVEEIEHREYPDTAAAIRGILAEVAPPRVYAVGEYHPTRGAVVRESALGLASPDRVVVWERGRDSYVVMLPAQSEEIGRVARP
ncbi:MAG TPA: hypothetical protein VN253_29945 [Kofleriaceae bacterium]|nr:hypothetical protein [Kofleriaceae bacterium]